MARRVAEQHIPPLLRQPFCIGHDINHGNGPAELQLRNQLEQKGSCRLSFLNKFVFGGTAISVKVPVRSDASDIEPSQMMILEKARLDRIAEAWRPITLEGQQSVTVCPHFQSTVFEANQSSLDTRY